jgi:hypothetical protein
MKNYKPVRRAQLIAPFGVGSMVDFPNDEALMAAGLDMWPYAYDDCPPDWMIVEERLQRRLNVSYFRTPPDFREDDINSDYLYKYVPFVRFPRWHFCSDPKCGRMVKLPLFGKAKHRCLAESHGNLPDFKKPKLIPVRFVAICPKGHIEDFPFMEWVHHEQHITPETNHNLSYKAGKSASLSGINIICSCGKRRNLAGAFNYSQESGGSLHKIGYDCKGNQPWLGYTTKEIEKKNCGQYLRTVQRGGSNVYFPKVLSSIYLPLWAEDQDPKIISVLEEPKVWNILSSSLEEGKYIPMEKCRAVSDFRKVDPEKLKLAAQKKLDGEDADKDLDKDEDFRRSEYEAFISERGGSDTDLFVEQQNLEDYQAWMGDFFKRICLVKKLRETRVLSGFSRLLPPDAVEKDFLQPLSRNPSLNWLPAMIVRGEGVFIDFSKDKIDEWILKSGISKRIHEFSELFNLSRINRGLEQIEITPKFILLHTFAHILIRQLSFDCGYGSAALRERIYCDIDDGADSMQGVLIYTAAGDSEGSMGGLVRQGLPGNLEKTVHQAIKNSSWCSSDPVCIESKGQGTESANLSACHACVLLPETSCEEGNRLLDRAVILGKPDDSKMGYFKDIMF